MQDLVHVGVATVVHQAAGQMKTHAKKHLLSLVGDNIVVCLEAANGQGVVLDDQDELYEDGSNGQPLSGRDFTKNAVAKGNLQL
jgi:hypothetical protein